MPERFKLDFLSQTFWELKTGTKLKYPKTRKPAETETIKATGVIKSANNDSDDYSFHQFENKTQAVLSQVAEPLS